MSFRYTSRKMCAHHSGFHRPHCFVLGPISTKAAGFNRKELRYLGIMRNIRRGMEITVDPMPSVHPNGLAPIRTSMRFTRREMVRRARAARIRTTSIILPISLNNAPGLHIAIALSRHSRDVRMSFADSSSIWPTGYVAFTSP